MNALPIALVVGLGNPGVDYEATRHNVGFMAIDAMRRRLGHTGEALHTAESFVWNCRIGGQTVYLQKPLTYMNNSGQSVATLARRHSLSPDQIVVICDDLDLPLGRLRLRAKGNSGGHNGIRSIIAELGRNDFNRLRLGIGGGVGRSQTVDYVLGKFTAEEEPPLLDMVNRAVDALQVACRRGISPAMNQFNSVSLPHDPKPDSEESAR